MSFKVIFPTIWANFDANGHMRHTAYNDYAAESRTRLYASHHFTLKEFSEYGLGPVLFEENTKFYREIMLGEDITVTAELIAASPKFERFKFKHHIIKADGVIAAEIKIYSAWIDLKKRKLATPPDKLIEVFSRFEKSNDFEKIVLKNKT